MFFSHMLRKKINVALNVAVWNCWEIRPPT
jgi:hypothetical protein